MKMQTECKYQVVKKIFPDTWFWKLKCTLKGNIGENLHDIEFVNDFIDMTPKQRQQKKKKKGMIFVKIKNIYISRKQKDRLMNE